MNPKKNWGKKRDFPLPQPKIVGQARDEFGTRRCQRVVCTKCERVDYIPVRVKTEKDSFCRDCAERHLAAYEQGRKIDEKKIHKKCDRCCRSFLITAAIADKKDEILCLDCLRGFEVWRGKTSEHLMRPLTERKIILTKTGSKTTFRKYS